jgi:hypothetical protein
VQPGQTGQIEVTVKTYGFNGALSKNVTVSTNDPRKPEIWLGITAVVQPEFQISDPAVFFGNVPIGREAKRELFITVASDRNLQLLSVTSSDPDITARLDSVPDSAGKKTKVTVTLKPSAKSGPHSGGIIIKTSSAKIPELSVYFRADVGPIPKR